MALQVSVDSKRDEDRREGLRNDNALTQALDRWQERDGKQNDKQGKHTKRNGEKQTADGRQKRGEKHKTNRNSRHTGRQANGDRGGDGKEGGRKQGRIIVRHERSGEEDYSGGQGQSQSTRQTRLVTRAPKSPLAKFLLNYVAASHTGKFRIVHCRTYIVICPKQ